MAAYGEITISEIHDGVGVSSVDIWFYLSTSQTELIGGQWTTNAPVSTDGKWIWTKTVTQLTNGESNETRPICVSGSSGATGKGIDTIEEEYYLSDSKTQQTGGSWVNVPPKWIYGKYMWTRIKITYKNPVSIEYTQPICDTSWETANDFKDELDNKISETITQISGVSTKVDQVEKSITDKVWQTDISTEINKYDNSTVNVIRDQVSENKTEIGKITSAVSDVQTKLEKKADGSTVHELSNKVSQIEQDASGFKQTVEENYAKKTDLSTTTESLRSEFTQKADEIITTVSRDYATKEELENSVKKVKSLQISLSNDNHIITVNKDGISDYSGCSTTVSLIYGIEDVTKNSTFQVRTSETVVGTWDENSHVYTVTEMQTESGYVEFIGTYENMSTTNRFHIRKRMREQADITIYELSCSTSVIQRTSDNSFFPKSIILNAVYKDQATGSKYFNGYFKVLETEDEISYVEKYTSLQAEQQKIYVPSSLKCKGILCKLFLDEKFENEIDSQTITVISDDYVDIGVRNLIRNSKTMIFADYGLIK